MLEIITGDNQTEVWELLTKLNHKLVHWVKCNGLALNLEKTKYMIFARKRNSNSDLEVVLNRVKIERKKRKHAFWVL